MEKCVLILSKFPPICGQVSTLNLWLARGLVAKGIRVIVCTDAGSPQKQKAAYRETTTGGPPDSEVLEGINITVARELSADTFLPFSDLSFVSYLSAADSLVKEQQPDVIFSHYLEPYALAGHFLSLKYGIPHVITHAGSDINRLCAFPPVKQLYEEIFAHAKMFAAKSPRTAKRFANATWCETAPYLPDPSYFSSDSDLSIPNLPWMASVLKLTGPIFGFYGKFTMGKSLPLILQAFSVFRQRHGVGHLIFVGGDIGSALSLRAIISEQGLTDVTTVAGFLPNWHIPRFIRYCSAILYLKSGYLIPEHMSIVPREVLACGTPLIATVESVSGLPAGLGKASHLCTLAPETDPDSLADTLERAVHLPRMQSAEVTSFCKKGHSAYVESWCELLFRS